MRRSVFGSRSRRGGRRGGRGRCSGRVPEGVGRGAKTDRVSGTTGRRLVGPRRPPARSRRTVSAVVVLHGSGVISSHSTGIADQLGSWGYVALAVDSLGPGGVAS